MVVSPAAHQARALERRGTEPFAPAGLPRLNKQPAEPPAATNFFQRMLGFVRENRAAIGGVILGAASLPSLVSCASTSGMTPISGSYGASREINGVRVTLASDRLSKQAQLEHYEKIIEAMGGKVTPGRTHVLGLRGMTADGKVHSTTSRGELLDTFVVLRRGTDGSAHVEKFKGSSYPGQSRSSASPDINGDGQGDVGMIAEGRYKTNPNGTHAGAPSYHVLTPGGSDRLKGVRDTNHDGTFSSEEWSASRSRGHTLGAVLFHATASDGSVSSIGCMNVADIYGFIRSVGGSSASFDYTLVNAAHPEAR